MTDAERRALNRAMVSAIRNCGPWVTVGNLDEFVASAQRAEREVDRSIEAWQRWRRRLNRAPSISRRALIASTSGTRLRPYRRLRARPRWLSRRARPAHHDPGRIAAMGFQPKSPMQIIRAKCLDCAGTAQEVRFCTSMTCENWLARTGKNPWRTPPSDALREARRERALKTFGKSSDAVNGAPASDEDTPGRVSLPAEALRSSQPGKIEALAARLARRRAP
jgi:hypothetical protein